MLCGHIEKIISGAMDIFLFYVASYSTAKSAQKSLNYEKSRKKMLIFHKGTLVNCMTIIKMTILLKSICIFSICSKPELDTFPVAHRTFMCNK